MNPQPQAPALRGICDALALPLDEVQAGRLLAFLELLQRWNATYNLTAIRDPAAMLTQHLADCLAVIGPLVRHLGTRPARRLLDVGSGGGLPGVVIAIMLPQLDVSCIDAVGKKAAFVRQVAAELRLKNLQAEHGRVETWHRPPFDVIVSRAFASLVDFVALTRPLLSSEGCWLAMKGKEPVDELASLSGDVSLFHVEPLAVPGLNADRCLVWLRRRSADAGANL